MSNGVYYDRHRRKWLYQPEPFTADDCEAVASTMPSDDTWAQDLLDAADKIREMEAE